MGFIADVHLAHDELALVPTMDRHPETTFRYEYEAAVDGRRLQFVSVFGEEYDALEESMAADPTVSNPERFASFDNRAIYRMEVETDREIVPDRCARFGVFVFAVTSAERGWVARVYLSDRDALAAFRTYARDRDISFRVTQLYDSSVSDQGTYFLTEQQYEILMMAYYAGYFDIPREITQDDLAERLDVTDSAVSQRLRRAISDLIAATIEHDRTPLDE